MPQDGELVVVQIDDVDMEFRRVFGTTGQGDVLNIFFREYPGGMLLIPKQGEMWLVVRRGWDWFLEKKLDGSEDHQLMLDTMGQGDMRLKAAATIYTEGGAMFLNGRPWGSTIRDSFHTDSGFDSVTLTHDAIETQTIQPQLNGVLIPQSMWTYWPETRSVEFLETLGEAGFLTVDYQTWMVNNDDAGTVSGRTVIRAIEEMTGPLDWFGESDTLAIAAITVEGEVLAGGSASSSLAITTSVAGLVEPEFFGAGATAESTTEGATITPVLPASTQAGDIAFVMIHFNTTSGTPTGPSGYTSINEDYAASMGYGLWWKRLVGGDADPTVTDNSGGTALSGSNGFFGRTYVYRNCVASGTPFEDATVSGTTNSTTPTTAAIDTTGPLRRAVNFLMVDNNTAWSSGHPPSGWDDEVADFTTGTAANHRDCVIYKQIPVAAAVGAETVGTLAGAQDWRCVTLALIPA